MSDQKSKLIHLAVEILRTTTPPSPHMEDHAHVPARVPIRWWRWMVDRLLKAEVERMQWSIRLREIADSLEDGEG